METKRKNESQSTEVAYTSQYSGPQSMLRAVEMDQVGRYLEESGYHITGRISGNATIFSLNYKALFTPPHLASNVTTDCILFQLPGMVSP